MLYKLIRKTFEPQLQLIRQYSYQYFTPAICEENDKLRFRSINEKPCLWLKQSTVLFVCCFYVIVIQSNNGGKTDK